jgi:hypothetical protein
MEFDMKKTMPVGAVPVGFKVTRLVTGKPNESVPVEMETIGARGATAGLGVRVTGITVSDPFGPVLVDNTIVGV